MIVPTPLAMISPTMGDIEGVCKNSTNKKSVLLFFGVPSFKRFIQSSPVSKRSCSWCTQAPSSRGHRVGKSIGGHFTRSWSCWSTSQNSGQLLHHCWCDDYLLQWDRGVNGQQMVSLSLLWMKQDRLDWHLVPDSERHDHWAQKNAHWVQALVQKNQVMSSSWMSQITGCIP